MAATDDAQLVERLGKRDETALVDVVGKYRKEVMGFLYRLLDDRQAAEEVFQDTLLRLWQSSQTLHSGSRLRPWLFRVARNRAIDEMRKVSWCRQKWEELPRGLPTTKYLPDEHVEQVWERACVTAAVKKLPLPYRRVILLRYFDGMSYQEIAKHLHIPVGTVKSRWMYARTRMRASLEYLRVG